MRKEFTCKWCGESFVKLESQVKDGRGQFCSRQCLGAWVVKYRRQVVSLIESRFVEVLRAAGVDFETQARVGKFVIDVLFPKESLAVQFDGDYWHSLPAMVARDKRKDAFLLAEGFRVLNVKEMDFVADADATVIAVLAAVESMERRG